MNKNIVKTLALGTLLIFGFSNAQNKTIIVLDNFFNHEEKINKETGKTESYHYIWEDTASSGFSLLGDLFTKHGAEISTLKTAPSKNDLKNTDIYIIVDPDIDKEAAGGKANFIDAKTIKNLTKWVKKGGVLVLLSNDEGNSEFEHFNQLAEKFGAHFDGNSINRLKGREFEKGAVYVKPDNEVFSGLKLYMKEVSTITVKEPAKPFLYAQNQVIGAISKFGKGTVFALGDPWCYNEYIDGKKLTEDFSNYEGTEEWVKWLLKQVNNKK